MFANGKVSQHEQEHLFLQVIKEYLTARDRNAYRQEMSTSRI